MQAASGKSVHSGERDGGRGGRDRQDDPDAIALGHEVKCGVEISHDLGIVQIRSH